MDLSKARYESTAVKPEQYPAGSIPEIALVGRSNVGKSTIINTLLNRKGIARVSSEPGKTRGINFYNIDDALYFVDLPGYGYAKVSKDEKAKWGKMIETYLNSRRQLQMVVLLVDIRHAPNEDDKMMYQWIMGRGLRRMVVATKTDKISRGQIHNRLQEIKKVLGLTREDTVIAYSSETKQGKDEVWVAIRAILSGAGSMCDMNVVSDKSDKSGINDISDKGDMSDADGTSGIDRSDSIGDMSDADGTSGIDRSDSIGGIDRSGSTSGIDRSDSIGGIDRSGSTSGIDHADSTS